MDLVRHSKVNTRSTARLQSSSMNFRTKNMDNNFRSRFGLDEFKRLTLDESCIYVDVLCDVLLNERCIMCYYYISSFLFITKVVTQRIEKRLNTLIWPGEL